MFSPRRQLCILGLLKPRKIRIETFGVHVTKLWTETNTKIIRNRNYCSKFKQKLKNKRYWNEHRDKSFSSFISLVHNFTTSAMCQQEICKYKNIMKSAMRKPLRQENMEMNKKCPWSSLLTKQISRALSFDCVKNFRSLAIHVTSIAKEQLKF